MGKIWEFTKWMNRGGMSEEEERLESLKDHMKKEWERTNTCKWCKKIFRGDGYPYQRTILGKVKNYVCEDCAKKLGLV